MGLKRSLAFPIRQMRMRLGGLEVSFPQVLLASGIVVFAFAMPGDLKFKLDALGFGVCHQIHTHSFTIGGHQLPLCARCSGIYLGAISAILIMSRVRRRAAGMPWAGMLGVLGLFFGAMVVDGFNSAFQTFGGGLWESSNIVRLVTGTMAGLAMAFVLYPVFNTSLWHREERTQGSVLAHGFELAGYLAAAGLLVALVLWGWDWLFYPLSLLSIGGLLALLTMSYTMIVLLATRKDGAVRTPHDALTFVLLGVALSLVMLTLMVWGRVSLAPMMEGNLLGVPVVPGLP